METDDQSKDRLEYEEIRRQVRERMLAHMRNGARCDEIEVKLWLPELTKCNVTLLCDRLLLDDINAGRQGLFILTTKTGDICCFSYWNIEEQSSGFKMKDYIMGENWNDPASVILEVNPSYVKDELIVPNNVGEGFYKLGKPKSDLVFTDSNSRRVSTAHFGHDYILNFFVGGEFKLEIDYLPEGEENFKRIFHKGFCCK